MRHFIPVVFIGFIVLLSSCLFAADVIDLSGAWRFALDSKSMGQQEGWFEKTLPGQDDVQLPGSIQEQGYGDRPGPDTPWMGNFGQGGWKTAKKYAPYRQPDNIKIPFWLQPVKYYNGRAWYQRKVDIPPQWSNKHIVLKLERCHWETTVWVDGQQIGPSQDSLCTPHYYELSKTLTPGWHTLTLLVENGYHVRVGVDSHAVTDHTQTNWNGVVGDIQLTASDQVWLEDVQVYPDVPNGKAKVVMTIGNKTGGPVVGTLGLSAKMHHGKKSSRLKPMSKRVSVAKASGTVEIEYELGKDVPLWDEFSPNLIDMEVSLEAGIVNQGILTEPKNEFTDHEEVTFGMRQITTDGRYFRVNGRRTFMRGTLECCIFPKTGYPATDVKEWRRIFQVCKAHGLNHMRFHSWCPPEAAFVAGDLEGMYLQPECGVWRGAGGPPSARPVEPWLYLEADRIIAEYGNHPSFILFAHGNEPWELTSANGREFWNKWVKMYKEKQDRFLVTSGAHHPLVRENEFHLPGRVEGFWIRYQGHINPTEPSTLRNYTDQIAQKAEPCIAHEVGQWCVFPNLKEIVKYTGVLKANNFEIVRDFLSNNNMLDQADDFLMASGKFQALLYKESIEAFLRTPGLGGYQLLDLHDFPGQGTALVGVLDAFWESKGYITPEQYRRFSGPVVPLAVMNKRVWSNDEIFQAEIRLAQFSQGPLEARPVWTITDAAGNRWAGGQLPKGIFEVGNEDIIGNVAFALSKIKTAKRLTLTIGLEGTDYQNDWAFWVYPKTLEPVNADDVRLCESVDAMQRELTGGKKVLLAPGPDAIVGRTAGTFQPIFWNKAWFPGQREHTLGILCDPRHQALRNFPTQFHSSWQWWDLQNNSKPMILDRLPVEVKPIIQPIDDWNKCRRLGLLFEARIGTGRVMVCSIDLTSDLDKRLVARQLKHSLLKYMSSKAFAPKDELTVGQLKKLLQPPALLKKLKPVVTADSANAGHEAAKAVDGDPGTIWHTSWDQPEPGYPHFLQLDFKQSQAFEGVRLLPRQDGNSNGWIKDIEIYVSYNGMEWTLVARSSLSNNHEWKTVDFDNPVRSRFLKVVAVTPQFSSNPWASLAELDLQIDK